MTAWGGGAHRAPQRRGRDGQSGAVRGTFQKPVGVTLCLSGPRTGQANEEQPCRQCPSGPVTPSALEATVLRRDGRSCPPPFGGPGRGSVARQAGAVMSLALGVRDAPVGVRPPAGGSRVYSGTASSRRRAPRPLPHTESLTLARRSAGRRQRTACVRHPHRAGVRGPRPSSVRHLNVSGRRLTSDILAAQPGAFLRVCFSITMETGV